jgi:hypothetical protein
MNGKLFPIIVLALFGTLALLQAIFSRTLGERQARRVESYSQPFKAVYTMFPANGRFMTEWRFIGGIVLAGLCYALAALFWFFAKPAAP